MTKCLKIGYLSNISDISQSSGILTSKIMFFIQKNKVVIYDNKLLFFDVVNLYEFFGINYMLLPVCNVVKLVCAESEKYVQKYIRYTIAFFGHVNHGKTTLIKKLTTRKIIETYEITQKVDIYQCKDLYLVDVPGHDIFYPVRENLVPFMGVIVIVISLHKGLERETERTLQFLLECSLFDKCIIAFTKDDIKKYESKHIIGQIKNKYGAELKYFMNHIDTNSIYKTLYDFASVTALQNIEKFDGIILRNEIIEGSRYSLVKINNGYLDRKSFLLTKTKICRVTKIKDLIKFKDIVVAYAVSYCYVHLDIDVEEYTEFYVSKNQTYICDYDKYLVAQHYIDSYVFICKNKTSKSRIRETIAEKRHRRREKRLHGNTISEKTLSSKVNTIIVVRDSMTKYAIENLLLSCKLEMEYKAICSDDASSALYLMDCKKIIYFCCSKSKNIEYSGQVLEIDNIYELINNIEYMRDDIKNNKFIANCAKITHIFNIKGVIIAGCLMLKGMFAMKGKVMVTIQCDVNGNYILPDSVGAIVVSLKKNTEFVKKIKLNDKFGITLGNFSNELKIGMYIYTHDKY